MATVTFEIDGQQASVEKGTTVLEAARTLGIHIPTLCEHPNIKQIGACRLCLVEVGEGPNPRLVASCSYDAREGNKVRTNSPRIERMRKLIVELLFPAATAGLSELGVTSSRFESDNPQHSECNLCGLCVRYCEEIAKKHVVYFAGRGTARHIAKVPGMEGECATCRACFDLCTGGWIVSHS